MAYVATHRDLPRSTCAEAPSGADTAVTPGFWRRFFNAVLEARQRKANDQLGEYLIRSGGRLTDDIEREMNHRLSRGDWNFR
jgi:hypothetical protein